MLPLVGTAGALLGLAHKANTRNKLARPGKTLVRERRPLFGLASAREDRGPDRRLKAFSGPLVRFPAFRVKLAPGIKRGPTARLARFRGLVY